MTEQSIGIVAIGRNEGERLKRCLDSLLPSAWPVVYVDSGSDDGSQDLAKEMGAFVVALDMSRPFTAARARNEGFERLLELAPDIEFVQFVDGDCEVASGWLGEATGFLSTNPQYALVCGRRRERYPGESIYNRMCDQEWNTPVGDAKSCGGDALVRVSAFLEAGGYRNSLIAGEEPEMCLRLRKAGWLIRRIDHEMTLHDAAMTYFGQWWKRSMRAGHAYLEGAWLHGNSPERHWVRETIRTLAWGVVIPLTIGILALLNGFSWLWLLVVYPLQWLRLWLHFRSASDASFMLLGRFAETMGMVKFLLGRLSGKSGKIIEYK